MYIYIYIYIHRSRRRYRVMEAVHSICAEEKRADTFRHDVYNDAVLFAEMAFKLINYTGIMLRTIWVR